MRPWGAQTAIGTFPFRSTSTRSWLRQGQPSILIRAKVSPAGRLLGSVRTRGAGENRAAQRSAHCEVDGCAGPNTVLSLSLPRHSIAQFLAWARGRGQDVGSRCARMAVMAKAVPRKLTTSPMSLLCPDCGAKPGKDCDTTRGGFAVVHFARIKAAAVKSQKESAARRISPK